MDFSIERKNGEEEPTITRDDGNRVRLYSVVLLAKKGELGTIFVLADSKKAAKSQAFCVYETTSAKRSERNITVFAKARRVRFAVRGWGKRTF
jgi:hypothetical protein